MQLEILQADRLKQRDHPGLAGQCNGFTLELCAVFSLLGHEHSFQAYCASFWMCPWNQGRTRREEIEFQIKWMN